MTLHLDLPYLNFIIDVIEDIERSINNISKERFLKNSDVKDANVRRIEIIGESIKNLSLNLKNKYKDFGLEKIETIKDKIAHLYFGVDFNLIWEILKKDIPILKEQILTIKKDTQKRGEEN